MKIAGGVGNRKNKVAGVVALLMSIVAVAAAQPARSRVNVSVHWQRTIIVSKSTPTFQVVVNPMLRKNSPIYREAFKAIRNMGANYVRYVPWFPYPKLAVAELKPPSATRTYWNFSYIDPMMAKFMASTKRHPVVINFSTIPEWMFKTKKPVPYPGNPNKVDWNYEKGTKLRDSSCHEVASYYARLIRWYTKGGFYGKYDKWHASGYHYHFPYWEVLNEVDLEHHMTPAQYTKLYDAIVSSIRHVSPKTKFIGLALSNPEHDVRYFEYFLNHAHHKSGVPINFISYHFYAKPTPNQGINNWQYTFFDQANGFLSTVRYIQAIRKRLSPSTKTDVDEIGVILPSGNNPNAKKVNIPVKYWNAAAALYAYLFIGLSRQGINIIGESQLVGYPSQFPSVSMIDWKNGKPNARYWVLKLIKDNFHPGDILVNTSVSPSKIIAAQGFIASSVYKLLLVNKRNRVVDVRLPQALVGKNEWIVDEATGESAGREVKHIGRMIELPAFAVAVITSR